MTRPRRITKHDISNFVLFPFMLVTFGSLAITLVFSDIWPMSQLQMFMRLIPCAILGGVVVYAITEELKQFVPDEEPDNANSEFQVKSTSPIERKKPTPKNDDDLVTADFEDY